MAPKKILLLHGINLGMFGKRDPAQYGTVTLAEIDQRMIALGKELGVEVTPFQTDSESEICARIHRAFEDKTDGIVINGGAWSHSSYALADALEIFKGPIAEVHMSNIYKREEFRHHSVLAAVARGQIAGFGVDSYLLGLRAVVSALNG